MTVPFLLCNAPPGSTVHSLPSRSARCTGSGASMYVDSSNRRQMSDTGLPWASTEFQPVSSSAGSFMKVTRPSTSVVMIASPMTSTAKGSGSILTTAAPA